MHSAAFSSGRLLLTASADGTACVWDVAPDRPPAAPLLQLEHSLHSPKPGASAAEAAANPKFAGEVRAASFFYLDRLLLLANANALHLYSYALQKQPTHDAARAPELRHRYKLAHRWPLPRAQTVTCLAAANSFLSPIALAAGSDHTLCAIDLGVGACVCEIEEAHARPIHTLRLHEGSAHGETPSAGHDLAFRRPRRRRQAVGPAQCVVRTQVRGAHQPDDTAGSGPLALPALRLLRLRGPERLPLRRQGRRADRASAPLGGGQRRSVLAAPSAARHRRSRRQRQVLCGSSGGRVKWRPVSICVVRSGCLNI